ncbi:MAG: FdhF/YdeP family oxidoreductase [Gemmatimonadetes bacterium]|nr:FdhF/YdeP family oxidoreductase [Gemmatimonadota bacterium]
MGLRDEEQIGRELETRGEPRSTRGDEADHGDVLAVTPEGFTALRTGEVKKTAAGLKAVQVAMRYAVKELGIVDGLKMISRLNQPDGFDCQSCAWADPAPKDRAFMAEYCENGVKVTAEENTRRVIPPEFFRRYSVGELSRRSDFWLQKQGRITQPMVLRDGATHYEPIEWDEAFRLMAAELKGLDSPDEAAFYTSGRTSNETAFLYQLFVRQFGTNNLPDCSNMCHESSGAALSDTIGVGKGTVTLDDLVNTDLVISVGQNPGSCHPRMLTALQQAKRNGAKIIAINPLPETGLNHFKHPQDLKHPLRALDVLIGAGTQLADLFVPVRVVGDVAMMKGILKELLEEEERRPGTAFDHEFIRDHTHGYDALVADLREESWELIVEQSGIAREQIRRAAEMVMAAERIIISWAMGLTQQPQAVAAIQQCVNLLLLRGSIGKPGAGALPVRGHSNVQGDRTMGIWERVSESFLDRLAAEFAFHPPRHHGYDTVESIKAMHAGKVKVFFGMGGNFLSATPDTEYTAEALRRCRLTAQVSIKLNRGHLVTGRQALILPTIGRAEKDVQATGLQFVTVENSMGVVSASRGVLEPVSDRLLSEPAIVARLAEATLGARSTVDWSALVADYDRIREHIERVVPGFEQFNRRIREPGGFYLPNLARDRREFTTTTRKANLTVHPIHRVELEPWQLIMMTMRSHDQFNTTVYGLDDRYRGIFNERRVVMMNAEDIRALGIRAGEVVDLTSHFRGKRRTARQFVVVEFPIPRRCAATYSPETNVLVPIESVAERSNTPTSKFVVITVQPSASGGRFDYDSVEQAQPLPGAGASA